MIRPLNDLRVLVLDCQATGAGPDKGHLLEIGWVETCAAASACPQALSATSYLARLPREAEIPAAVERVTGISKASLADSLPPVDIWRNVVQTTVEIAASDRMIVCPTVIHYARYEDPFLKNLHHLNDPAAKFPLRIICTHAIARRLLPGLPRKGLRALAGYFGHAVPRHRRSADHAVATAVIWHHLVQTLTSRHGIDNLDQLTDWLDRTPLDNRPVRIYPIKPEARLNIPEGPGIYRMRRANGDLLYIGKAKSLKKRVNSYFRQKGVRGEHTLEMLSQAVDLDVTCTGSALEAAVLESDDIKRHAPPYNIALQQGRHGLAFCSRDLLTQSATADNIHCIGPLPDGNASAVLAGFAAWHEDNGCRSGDDWIGIGTAVLGLPAAWAPPPECLAEGLVVFDRRHRRRLKRSSPLRALTGLGAALWRAHLFEKARAEAGPDADEDETDARDRRSREEIDWTPESVAGALEKSIMRGAQLIRRSRWFCLLSESAPAWEVEGTESGRKIVLVLEKGVVCRRKELTIQGETPVPPGYHRRMSERQKSFDWATYERLRVLTTELRRLMDAGRMLDIRLGPVALMNRRHLAKILPWV